MAQANQELLFAVSQIHDRLADLYSEALPAATAGWETDGLTQDNMGRIGGGVSVQVQYMFNDESGEDYLYRSVTIGLMSDSPMLSTVMMLINNPMYGSGRAVTVEGCKAAEEWDGEHGKLQFVIDNRVLVTIDCNGLSSREEMREWAGKINFAHLKKVIAS
ncbi:hypothetical protein GF324_12820 [bacterium]|nr:hypothetical protein [bacterium]